MGLSETPHVFRAGKTLHQLAVPEQNGERAGGINNEREMNSGRQEVRGHGSPGGPLRNGGTLAPLKRGWKHLAIITTSVRQISGVERSL